MLLNPVEYAMVNNPFRAAFQRWFEAERLLRMGGALNGGAALEMGCGRGVGAGIILDHFRAASVDAFDLDPRMVRLARKRMRGRSHQARFWVGDASSMAVPDGRYDAVFDFAIIHHIPDWRTALTEIHRVLKPGGRLFAEEVLDRFILNPVFRRLLDHPLEDRFDLKTFCEALEEVGLRPVASSQLGAWFGWVVAVKP